MGRGKDSVSLFHFNVKAADCEDINVRIRNEGEGKGTLKGKTKGKECPGQMTFLSCFHAGPINCIGQVGVLGLRHHLRVPNLRRPDGGSHHRIVDGT